MGACFSRTKGRRGPPPPGTAANCADSRGGPPPEPEEPQEETVKEVLSETPKLKAPRPSREEVGIIEKEGGNGIVLTGDARDDRSEVTSEVCSVSEGLSASTALTEVTGEERPPSASPVKFQRKQSCSSSDILLRREKMAGSVAAVGCRSGRSSPSPAKRREGGGGAGRTRAASTVSKSRGGFVGSALCQDPGERSGRRSVSPVPKRTSAGQCRSSPTTMRANGRSSPRRVAGGRAVEGGRFRGDGRRMAQHMVECSGGGDAAAGAVRSGGKETLENPLVSLECFIFL